MAEADPKPGMYEHYKGGKYVLLHIGRLSEAREVRMAVYLSCTNGEIWIRPLSMFQEFVRVDERGLIPRFKYIPSLYDAT